MVGVDENVLSFVGGEQKWEARVVALAGRKVVIF